MFLCCGTAEQGVSQVGQWYIRWIKVLLLPGGLGGWAACTSSPAMPWHRPSIPQCPAARVDVLLLFLCRAAATQPVPPQPCLLPAHPLQLSNVSLVAFFSQIRPFKNVRAQDLPVRSLCS